MRGMDKRILSTAPNCPIVESVPRQGIRRGETLGQERHSGRTTRKTNPKIKPCEISEQSTIYVSLSLSKSVARNSIRDRHPAWIFAISHNFTQNGETEKSPQWTGHHGRKSERKFTFRKTTLRNESDLSLGYTGLLRRLRKKEDFSV